jgi:hypothetical protein
MSTQLTVNPQGGAPGILSILRPVDQDRARTDVAIQAVGHFSLPQLGGTPLESDLTGTAGASPREPVGP